MKVMVIAGGVPQMELLRQLKERKLETVLLDGNENCLARNIADKFYKVNIFNIEDVKKIAIDEKVDFIITVCADQVLLVVAQVSEMLGLPCYIGYKQAQDVSDKIRMKRIFKENGIPTTKYLELENLDMNEISKLNYPLVVKPVDAYSSKGVRKAETEEELITYYNEAKVISRSGGVIVEEFFKGEEISVDAFVLNGKAHILSITNSEKVKDKDRFVIFRGRYPANIPDTIRNQIEDVAQKIADSFGLVNSPLLVQLLHNGMNISVLEFCARTGGNMKWLLIKNSCGVDVITATIDITLGLVPDITPKKMNNNIVVNDFIYCKPGVFDHFEGFDELVEQGIINEFHPVRTKGTEMHGVTSSSDRIAGMNILANSVDEYNQKLKTILEHIAIVDNKGNDMTRRDLLPEMK